MSIKVFSMAILASLLFVSCSQTSTDDESRTTTTTSANELKTYEVEIEAQADEPANEPETRAAMPFKVTEENIKGKAVLYPKLNITQETMPSMVVLYNKSNGAKEVVEANWSVIKEATGIKFNLNKLNITSNLANGEWYMMSFMGGEKNGDKLSVNTQTTIDLMEKGKEFTASCPFATNWRRIVKTGNKLKLSNENKKMVFKPQGVFLALSLESRMTLPTKINRTITMESNAFCTSGEYNFNVDRNSLSDDADKAADYWEPNSQQAISGMSAVYEKYNARHYRSTIKLNYNSGKNDGTLRNGQSDLDSYIYFNSYNKSTGTNTPNTRTNRGFLLCLMPVNYKKTSDYGGIVNETLLYGKVDVTDPNRTNFTNNTGVYATAPNTWRPYMGNRYLLGSFSDELSKGSSYDMTLRIIRPNLPIERLWAYRYGKYLQKKTRTEADRIAQGQTVDNTNYPFLSSKLYRLPKYTEFTPVFNNPKLQLDNGTKLGEMNPIFIGTGYGYGLTADSHRYFVDLNGVQRKFSNWYSAEKGSKVMYAIMYMKPVTGGDPNPTNNYKVAVRMTFPAAQARSGVVRVETYYLGSNYNLSFNVAGYFICHPDFWKKLDGQDIILREFQLGSYWLSNGNIIQGNEPRSTYTDFNLTGVAQNPQTGTSGWSYFLPWLRKPAW